jgi:hypothetical protein
MVLPRSSFLPDGIPSLDKAVVESDLTQHDSILGTIRTHEQWQAATWILSARLKMEMLAPSSNSYNDMIARFSESRTASRGNAGHSQCALQETVKQH